MDAKQAGTDDKTLIRNAELEIKKKEEDIKRLREWIYMAAYRMVRELGSSEAARQLDKGRSTVEYLALKGEVLHGDPR
jgi:hypothetical protein